MHSQKIKCGPRRPAATCNGLKKRVRDLVFEQVSDPRMAGKVDYPLPTMLTALVVSMATMARSLRAVEQRTGQMAHKRGRWMGIERRIADNTFGKVLPRLSHGALMPCLHRLVKAEHRRGNLKPTRLKRGTVAIDGHTNEYGSMPALLDELKAAYGKTRLFSLVTTDAELMEDRRRPAWSRHPQGSLVVSALRMMALCILAVARRLSRHGYSKETPSWGQVAEHFLLELCGSILETKAFDTV
jgi:hypothetical protein